MRTFRARSHRPARMGLREGSSAAVGPARGHLVLRLKFPGYGEPAHTRAAISSVPSDQGLTCTLLEESRKRRLPYRAGRELYGEVQPRSAVALATLPDVVSW